MCPALMQFPLFCLSWRQVQNTQANPAVSTILLCRKRRSPQAKIFELDPLDIEASKDVEARPCLHACLVSAALVLVASKRMLIVKQICKFTCSLSSDVFGAVTGESLTTRVDEVQMIAEQANESANNPASMVNYHGDSCMLDW